jgi:cellulose-binding protein
MTSRPLFHWYGWICEFAIVLTVAVAAASAHADDPSVDRSRAFVLTDISNEPDDEESLVRFLVYANEYDIEGLVATTSTWLRNRTREDLLRRQIDAYGQVRENLAKHADRFPSKDQLLAVTATGQPTYGMAAVGDGKATEGSKLLLAAADKADDRPLWVSIWGGANTLAQALYDARRERSADDLEKLVAKLRVYTISDQDDAGVWLRREFPELFYIVSPSNTDSKEYWRATWTGISGDRHYKNGPLHKFEMVDNPWLEENVIKNHGPLGALYPRLAFIMEGDTPSFLGLINNGLGWHASPVYGGWGGRYVLYKAFGETRPIWTNNLDSRDTVTAENGQTVTSDQATIWRWREDFQNDFAARMDWCVVDEFKRANHNPIAVLNSDTSKRVLTMAAKPGETVKLSASGSTDPDGNTLTTTWFVYPEAGGLRREVALSETNGETTSLVVPQRDRRVVGTPTIHVILTARDNGTPSLVAYRRAIVEIRP